MCVVLTYKGVLWTIAKLYYFNNQLYVLLIIIRMFYVLISQLKSDCKIIKFVWMKKERVLTYKKECMIK